VKENKLKDGDIVLITRLHGGGICIRYTRTPVWQAERKNENVWNIVRKAQDEALKTAKPGVCSTAGGCCCKKRN